jgi:hypothetical protein
LLPADGISPCRQLFFVVYNIIYETFPDGRKKGEMIPLITLVRRSKIGKITLIE